VTRLFALLTLFGVAFGYVEATVVVYLREIFYADGFRFPLTIVPEHHGAVEVAREAATMLMLAAVAHLAGRTRWERFGHFAFLFGVWDIAFYLGLYAVLRWPESLLTWDVLFLIPLIWTGPVLAPVLVSALLVTVGAAIAVRERRGPGIRVGWIHWALGLLSLALLLYAFMANHGVAYAGGVPASFPWAPFFAGLAIGAGTGWSALAAGKRRGG
jgi:hypothetical protein